MVSRESAEIDRSCLQIAGQAAGSFFGKLVCASSQVLDAGKVWMNKFLKKNREKGQGDEDNPDDHFQAPNPLNRFAPVLRNINTAVIQEYASCIRRARMPSQQYEVTPWIFVCTTDREPLHGSSNILIPLCFGDGVRWLFKVPSAGYDTCWNDIASRALTSEVSTMRLLRHSGLPIPEVYSFEASIDNALGCPFILMEHMRGRPVYEGWFDHTLSNEAQEQFRQRCLQTLALTMKKLGTLRFAQAGTLNYNSDSSVCTLQPIRVPDLKRMSDNILEWQLGNKELDDGDYFLEIGPFDSDDGERDYLMSLLDQQPPAEGKLGQGIYRLLRLFMEWMPQDNTKGSFVISHPDLDLQNVLVDESGAVTGLIDWDGVATVSQLAGCTYPNWLTYDWDPWNYDYRSGQLNVIRGRPIPSPRELKRYRQLYTGFLEQAPAENGENTFNLKYADTVRKSLLLKSLKLAIQNPNGTDNIVLKIFKLIAQVSGQETFRQDIGSLPQADDSCELSSFEPGRVLANIVTPEEEGSSSATSKDTNQSVEDDESRYTRDSTPPAEMSSTSSIESDDAHVDSAMDGVIASTGAGKDQRVTRVSSELVVSSNSSHSAEFSRDIKGRYMRSGLRKFLRNLTPLRKSSNSRFGHEGTTRQSITVDNTRFVIANPRHTASNAQMEYTSLAGQIQNATADNIESRSVSPNSDLGETNTSESSEEVPSSTAISANAPSRDLLSAQNHSTNDSPAAVRIFDTTGARPQYLGRPSKCAQEISHVVRVQATGEVLEKDTETPSTAQSKSIRPHAITKSTLNTDAPRPRRRLVKKQTLRHNGSTSSAPDPSSSSPKSGAKGITSWLKSVVHKRGPKDHSSALSASQSHPSTIEASATTAASDSANVSVEQDACSTISPSAKEPLETALEPAEPSAPQPAQDPQGPQKFDLDNLELIDNDQLWEEGFMPIQVCHDLVDGTLDEARMRRLRTGFEVLLNSL